MFIHLGNDIIVKENEIVGIFDIEITTISYSTRKFLSVAEKKGETKTVSYEMPKSFVLCNKKKSKEKMVYITPISSSTLLKRSRITNKFKG